MIAFLLTQIAKLKAAVSSVDSALSPTAYSTPTMSTGATLASGGFVKIGNMVFVSMRVTTASSVSAICSALPAPLVSSQSITDAQGVVEVTTNASTPCYITKEGSMVFTSAVSTTPLIISCSYICA